MLDSAPHPAHLSLLIIHRCTLAVSPYTRHTSCTPGTTPVCYSTRQHPQYNEHRLRDRYNRCYHTSSWSGCKNTLRSGPAVETCRLVPHHTHSATLLTTVIRALDSPFRFVRTAHGTTACSPHRWCQVNCVAKIDRAVVLLTVQKPVPWVATPIAVGCLLAIPQRRQYFVERFLRLHDTPMVQLLLQFVGLIVSGS